jgi:hypothetical protein
MNTITDQVEVPVASGDLGLMFIDGESTTVIDVESVTVKQPGILRRAVRVIKTRIALGLIRALFALKRVAARLTGRRVAAVTYVKRTHQAHVYRPRHAARRTWYARQRSTSEYTRARRDQAKEDELRYPPEFISWVDNFIETLREEQDVMHSQERGRHFICS